MDRWRRASLRTCTSSAPSPCRRPTGPRPRSWRAPPACGACSPASAAPASSTGRYCLSFAVFPTGCANRSVDDLAVEHVYEVLHEAVALHRFHRLDALRFALAGFERCGARSRHLADSDVHAYGAAQMLVERGLELLDVIALGKISLRLGYDEVVHTALLALQLGFSRELASRAGDGELLHELRPIARCGGPWRRDRSRFGFG